MRFCALLLGVFQMNENKEYIIYPDEKGNICISEDVVSMIASSAAMEVEGVAGLSTTLGKDLAEFLGKKNVARGVKIKLNESDVAVDVFVLVDPNSVVSEVGKNVQEAVSTAVESMTGFAVSAVNVHICGIAF